MQTDRKRNSALKSKLKSKKDKDRICKKSTTFDNDKKESFSMY